MQHITRFAPSPTGRLHLGHIYSAMFAARLGKAQLRIEDLDHTRCRQQYIEAIFADLALAGCSFADPVYQSRRYDLYRSALAQLEKQGVLYPCFCTRSELALAADHKKPRSYSGRCKKLTAKTREAKLHSGTPYALRLDVDTSHELAGAIHFTDLLTGKHQIDYLMIGDPVIARKEIPASYHLACVVDDAAQGITLVTRAADLLPACHVQRLLQQLLGLPVPQYCHHPLLLDADNRRLAKRRESTAFYQLIDGGSYTIAQLHKEFDYWYSQIFHRQPAISPAPGNSTTCL